MFSSGNTNDPFSYTNEALFGNSFANEANPNSSQQEPSSLFCPFPSPLPDETLVEGSGTKAINNINTGTEHMGIKDCPKNTSNAPPNPNPTRKTGRKDRHSKICTAHGLRDRRMRLSVQTARKFFDLQDMLGFDKASETIEWLFSKSKPAIREAARNHSPVKGGCSSRRKSALFSSKCDDGSDMEESGHEEDGERGNSDISTFFADRKSIRKSRRGASGENGSSEIARAGARERIRREKLITMSVEEPNQHLLSNPSNLEQFHWDPLESPSDFEQLGRPWSPFETADEWMIGSTENSKQYLDGNPSDLEQLGPWSPFETADESCSNSHERNSAVGPVPRVEEPSPHSVEHQLATMGMSETFLGTASSSTLPSVFDLQNNLAASDGEESNTFLGTLEYWDMHCERINPYCCPTNMDPIFTGNIIQEQNPNPTSSFDFESHFMGSIFSCRPFDGNDSHSLG